MSRQRAVRDERAPGPKKKNATVRRAKRACYDLIWSRAPVGVSFHEISTGFGYSHAFDPRILCVFNAYGTIFADVNSA